MMDGIATLFTQSKAVFELSTALIAERDKRKADTIKVELNEHIINLQITLRETNDYINNLQGKNADLRKQNQELKEKLEERGNYQLVKMKGDGEFFAYQSKGSEETHFVCQPCFDNGKKAVLLGNGRGYWQCPVCKQELYTEGKVSALAFELPTPKYLGY